jgi:hypothetical protein
MFRNKRKSKEYHEEVKQRLNEGARRVQQAGHEPVLKITPVDQAEIDQAVFKHEVTRHVDRKGRKVR